MSRPRFLLTFALAAVLAMWIPFDPKLMPLFARSLTTAARVTITGNSVLTHISKCDANADTISDIIAHQLRQPVLDLSFPGQSLAQAVNLAAAALRNRHTQTVVFPLSVFALNEGNTTPIREYLLFRLINPRLPAPTLLARLAASAGTDSSVFGAFDYGGVHYPDYDGLKAQYFAVERRAMTCPENDGFDMRFVAANFHHTFFDAPFLPADIALIANLGAAASQQGKSLLVVILPIDYELMDKLRLPGVDDLHMRVATLTKTLEDQGLKVLDLSATLPDADFADRWCACGHLLQSGRSAVAHQIDQHVSEAIRAVAAH